MQQAVEIADPIKDQSSRPAPTANGLEDAQTKSVGDKTALVSGARIAGLSTAYWLAPLGYKVTVIEIAAALRVGGTAVDIRGNTVDIVARMGILDAIKSSRLSLERVEKDRAQRTFALVFGAEGSSF